MKALKKSVSILAISALAIGAIETSTILLSSGAAHAKSDNGNGNGNSGGNGNGNSGGNGNGNSGDNGNSGGNGNSGNSGGNGNSDNAGNGNKGGGGQSDARGSSGAKRGGGLTKNGKFLGIFPTGKPAKPEAKPKPSVKPQQASAKSNPASDKKAARAATGMHPSQLGSMNGALNANINAVLAHIRNGNTNGPVGAMAALAAADHNAIGAQAVVDSEALYNALAEYGYTSVQEYYDDLEGLANIVEVDQAIADLEIAFAEELLAAEYESLADYLNDAEAEPIEALDTAIAEAETTLNDENAFGDSGVSTLADYNDALEGIEPIDALDGEEGAITTYEDTYGEGSALAAVDPSEEEAAAASDALLAQDAAEAGIMEAWNKHDPEGEEALLDGLRSRFTDEDEQAAIAEAIAAAEAAAAAAAADESTETEGESEEGEAEGEEVAAAE